MLLIEEGLTLDATIPAAAPYQAVHFRFRPALAEDVYEFIQGRKDSGRQRLAATVAVLHKHLVSWDVTDERDAPVAITPEILTRVPRTHLDQMLDFVTGYTDATA